MSLPIIKMCKNTNVRRLFASRNIPKNSPIFKLLRPREEDDFGKFIGKSKNPTCVIYNAEVTAACNIMPGMQLTIDPTQ